MKLAQAELEKNQGRNKNLYNRKAKKRSFQVGDKVLVLLPTDQNKLFMQWKGPFEIKVTKWGKQLPGRSQQENKDVPHQHVEALCGER